MGLRLSEILKPFDTGSITLRGQKLPLRAVMAWEESELERQDPPPIATSDNFATEQYQLDRQQHQTRKKAALFGIAAAIENGKGEEWTPDRDRKWVRAWAVEIAGNLSDIELTDAYSAAKAVGYTLPPELQKSADRIGTADKPGN